MLRYVHHVYIYIYMYIYIYIYRARESISILSITSLPGGACRKPEWSQPLRWQEAAEKQQEQQVGDQVPRAKTYMFQSSNQVS